MPRSFHAISEYLPAAAGEPMTVTGTWIVTLLSLTATTAVPAVMPLTVITLSWMETVATAVLAEDADTVPDALLGVILPLVPADSDIDVGETVIDGVTVTSTLRVRLLSRTEIVVFPAASPYTFKASPWRPRCSPIRRESHHWHR